MVILRKLTRTAKVIISKSLPDQRIRFYDLTRLKRNNRKPESQVLQFYSAVDNIGNYTPVLGIQDMLGFSPDKWDCHEQVDWEYVNRNYKAIIIGGAGLLHGDFTPFWQDVAQGCQLPMVIWGVGGCFPSAPGQPAPVDIEVAKLVFERSAHINLRDAETATFYKLNDCHISMCPTVLWLGRFRKDVPQKRSRLLLSEHVELVPMDVCEKRKRYLEDAGVSIVWTDNVQRRFFGLHRMITKLYMQSWCVVATRLHGAIIAHGLNIPYIVRVHDKKLAAFIEEREVGVIAKTDEEILSLIHQSETLRSPFKSSDEAKIEAFGARVRTWLHDLRVEQIKHHEPMLTATQGHA